MAWGLVWVPFMICFAALPLSVESVYVISNWNSQAEMMPSGNLKYVALMNHAADQPFCYKANNLHLNNLSAFT